MIRKPLRIALLDDVEIIAHGLRSMLQPYSERIEVVQWHTGRAVDAAADVVLHDFNQAQPEAVEIAALLECRFVGALAIYTWNMHPDLAAAATAQGCRGYLDKSLSAEQLVESLEAIAAGETVVSEPHPDKDGHLLTNAEDLSWPGAGIGLTARESEVLGLITQGLTNQDIATKSFLSINSVKSYIRSAYRKIGVERRSQAVRWGLENGMLPDFSRVNLNA